MLFAELIETLNARGLSVVRGDGDRLRCAGDTSQLTPDLQQSLSEHRGVFLSLLPSDAERCRQIVEQAIDDANKLCPYGRTMSETAFEAMDEFQDLMHDCARLSDIDGTTAAADQYLRVVQACCVAGEIHAWADATQQADAGPAMATVDGVLQPW